MTITRPTRQQTDAISRMDRFSLIRFLSRMRCSFKMDFSREYLETISLDQLRHIVLAACQHAISLPKAS